MEAISYALAVRQRTPKHVRPRARDAQVAAPLPAPSRTCGAGGLRAEEPPLWRVLPTTLAAPAQPAGTPPKDTSLSIPHALLSTPGGACSHVLNGIYHTLVVSSPVLSPASRPPGRALPARSIHHLSLSNNLTGH